MLGSGHINRRAVAAKEVTFEGISAGQVLVPAALEGQTLVRGMESALKLSHPPACGVSADLAHGIVDVVDAEAVAREIALGDDDTLVNARDTAGEERKGGRGLRG